MAGVTKALVNQANLQPLTLFTNNTPGMRNIRAISVQNTSQNTTVFAFIGSDVLSNPVLKASPGATITLPVQGSNAVSFSFGNPTNNDGGFTLHIDDQPLSASGSSIITNTVNVDVTNFPAFNIVRNEFQVNWAPSEVDSPLYISKGQELFGLGNSSSNQLIEAVGAIAEDRLISIRMARAYNTSAVSGPDAAPNIFGGFGCHSQYRVPILASPGVPYPIAAPVGDPHQGDIWILPPITRWSANQRIWSMRGDIDWHGLAALSNDSDLHSRASRVLLCVYNHTTAVVTFSIHARLMTAWPDFWFIPFIGGFGGTGQPQCPLIFKESTALEATNPIYYTHPVLAIRGDVTDNTGSSYTIAAGKMAVFELDPSIIDMAGAFASESSASSYPHTLMGYTVEVTAGQLYGGVDGNGGFLPVISTKFWCDGTLPLITGPT